MNRCFLCRKKRGLKRSHIYSKFLYKRVINDETGTHLILDRNGVRKSQNQIKYKMLCKECEIFFGLFETLAGKYLQDYKENFYYGNWMFWFVLSISWRILQAYYIDSTKSKKFMEWHDNTQEVLNDNDIKIELERYRKCLNAYRIYCKFKKSKMLKLLNHYLKQINHTQFLVPVSEKYDLKNNMRGCLFREAGETFIIFRSGVFHWFSRLNPKQNNKKLYKYKISLNVDRVTEFYDMPHFWLKTLIDFERPLTDAWNLVAQRLLDRYGHIPEIDWT